MSLFMPSRPSPRVHKMQFGAEPTGNETTFRLWAPKCKSVQLRIKGRRSLIDLEAGKEGWHGMDVSGVGAGSQYKYVLPDGTEIADPASRHQPGEVDGFSEVIDPAAYEWRDRDWFGRPWEEAIIYELHFGAFTDEGTFLAAIEKLDHLKSLGITAIQMMPLADWYGRFNWGYDGVMWFAPASQYGRPEDLKAFIDASHQRSIMVFLDVVYNHIGAVGNMLPVVAPIFTKAHESPWGEALNFDGKDAAVVREYVIENALYWITEFNLDGLRFDAIHAITDDSTTHILDVLSARIRAARKGRHTHLIVENSKNEELWIRRDTGLEPVHFTAQWNDDLHHILHTAATGENTGYYEDFDSGLSQNCHMLGRALAEGFVYQGEYKPSDGGPNGQPSVGLPPTAFISYMQNHDQIGNRIKGDRICTLTGEDAVLALASVYLLAPQIPMVFMGEEWGARQRFSFFSDMPEDLREATRKGRMEELKSTPEHDDPTKPRVEDAIDPTSIATFKATKLVWSDLDDEASKKRLHLYRTLIDVRRAEILPRLPGIGGFVSGYKTLGNNAVMVHWTLGDGSRLRLYLNLSSDTQDGVDAIEGRQIWLQGFVTEGRLGPWTTLWTIDIAPDGSDRASQKLR